MADDMLDVIAHFENSRVLVIGDVIPDEYIWGTARRVSPESPVPVVERTELTYALGGAANVAANISSLGGVALLGGVVGNDTHATIIRKELSAHGIIHELVSDRNRPTTTKTRIIAHHQHVARLDYEDSNPIASKTEQALSSWIRRHIQEADIIVLSDYAKGVITPVLAESVIRLGCQTKKPVIVAPKGLDYRKYRGASLVVPNLKEAREAAHHVSQLPNEIEAISQELLAQLEGSDLLITRGSEGMTLARASNQLLHIRARARNVYDVTGAGDTVAATLALALASGAPLEKAALLANSAAGIAVGHIGTCAVNELDLIGMFKTC